MVSVGMQGRRRGIEGGSLKIFFQLPSIFLIRISQQLQILNSKERLILDFHNIGFIIIPFDESKEDESEKNGGDELGTKLKSGKPSRGPSSPHKNSGADRLPYSGLHLYLERWWNCLSLKFRRRRTFFLDLTSVKLTGTVRNSYCKLAGTVSNCCLIST